MPGKKGVLKNNTPSNAISFAWKDIIEYLSDCPALVQKIEYEEFKKDDLEAIVRFYNADCP